MSIAGDKLSDILSGDYNCILFLHNTNKKDIAQKILKDGFCFEDQLAYSTDRINPRDAIEINYFLVERKEYGYYTIIIEINKKLFKQYNKLAEVSGLHFEEILTITTPVLSENDEFIYTLSPHYIKGYFNNQTGELTPNSVFDPDYDSPVYLENCKRLMDEQ